jgi:hypothetical protein
VVRRDRPNRYDPRVAVRQLETSPRRTTGVVARPGRIRLFGPLVALLLPLALLGVAGAIWVAWPCDGIACVKPSLAAYGLGMFAVPTALLAGLPWFIGGLTIAAAAITSAVLWIGMGRWAAARATADVDATWRTFWVELLTMAAGVWCGVLGGLAATGIWLSR